MGHTVCLGSKVCWAVVQVQTCPANVVNTIEKRGGQDREI